MESNRRTQIIKASAVIFSVIVFLSFTLMKQAILGIILAVGFLLFGFAIIHLYRTDFSDAPEE